MVEQRGALGQTPYEAVAHSRVWHDSAPTVTSVRSALTRHGRDIETVFDLLGRGENDLIAALGFTLSRSQHLTTRLLELFGLAPAENVGLRMETADALGRTDLELETAGALVVVEAKRGWRLPTPSQLEQYANRVTTHGGGLLVTLSDCSDGFAAYALPDEVLGVSLRHLSWAAVKAQVRAARSESGGAERCWLGELAEYLRRAVRVTDPASSWAYCVSVSLDRPASGGSRTFRDFVLNDEAYFHPFGWGSGWPTDPPNFLAFRWDGKVHQIRRVVAHDVVPNLQARWPDVPEDADTMRPHAVYRLGPPLPMHGPVPSGTNYRAARLWVLVDQRLTAPTLKDALASSKALTGTTPGIIDSDA